MSGKNILVTGGGSGIGLAVCKLLAKEGMTVFAGYRNKQIPTDEFSEEEKTVIPVKLDVNDTKDISRAVKYIETGYGYISGLVNCAGIIDDALLMMMSENSWKSVIDTDLNSLYHTVTAVLPGMMAAGGGAIGSVSSVAGLKGVKGQTNYCAAKAGVIGFTRALSREVAKMNIRVNAVAPGYIETPMTEKIINKNSKLLKEIPLQRFGTPSDIANAVRFLLSDEASYITGTTLTIDGGMLA